MTDKEKLKLAQIMAEHLCPESYSHFKLYGDTANCYSRENFAECKKITDTVDALIATGLTFNGEWKHKFEVAQKKLEKWQNIYFLALKNAIKFYGIELCPIECPFQYNFCGSDDCINLLAENFMQQAEKELAEERKE